MFSLHWNKLYSPNFKIGQTVLKNDYNYSLITEKKNIRTAVNLTRKRAKCSSRHK